MALLEVEDLIVEFRTSGGYLRAVDGISFSLEKGEILAVVGESGSGKSVSMLAILGLLPNTARVRVKSVMFEGRDLTSLAPRQRRRLLGSKIAMIFQEPVASLNPCFSVGFQIDEVLERNSGMSKRARLDNAVELLERVGIPSPAERLASYPHQLSGGQCQRIMIAMALACDPVLLVADEPTTALDVTVQKQILDLLVSLQVNRGMGMILITHDMGVVAGTADRVLVQYAGKVMECSDVVSIFETPQSGYTRALLSALPENATGDRLPVVSDWK